MTDVLYYFTHIPYKLLFPNLLLLVLNLCLFCCLFFFFFLTIQIIAKKISSLNIQLNYCSLLSISNFVSCFFFFFVEREEKRIEQKRSNRFIVFNLTQISQMRFRRYISLCYAHLIRKKSFFFVSPFQFFSETFLD